MKRVLLAFFLFNSIFISAQQDYSSVWEDLYSYNNVKDIVKVNDLVYALTDNAVFTYDVITGEMTKISSVQGLSGDETSAIHYSEAYDRIVIGYKSGLIEVVNDDKSITVSADIVNFNQAGSKAINDIEENGDILYLSTPFAIIEYDIANLEFGDTFFIGLGSSEVHINDVQVNNNRIYAATNEGVFMADASSTSLIDFNSWHKISNTTGMSYGNITLFNNELYLSQSSILYRLEGNVFVSVGNMGGNIVDLKSSSSHLSVSLKDEARIYNSSMTLEKVLNHTLEFDFELNTSFVDDDFNFLGTTRFGVLKSLRSVPDEFEEIHPKGPQDNDVFSLDSKEGKLWMVYGGYTATFAPIKRKLGYTMYDGEEWFNKQYSNQENFPGLVDVTIDSNNSSRVLISSFGASSNNNTLDTGGLLEINDFETYQFYNHTNSPLKDIVPNNPSYNTVRISGSTFDNQGNLWLTNIGSPEELIKFTGSSWSSYDISRAKPNSGFGLTQIVVDRNNTVWMGSRNDGIIGFNENGKRVIGLSTNATQGSLPHEKVKSLAVDKDNRLWIGSNAGLVVLNNLSGIFEATVVDAQPIIFEEEGIAKKLLGDETVNAITVDGANNKWFGTSTSGVVYTNPNGQETIATFNKDNSPLPSNNINSIAVDELTGKVYIATDKGMLAYSSKVAPFGNTLSEVYAYPNPARKDHLTVTIDGRNGSHLPEGTNLKIVDVAGNLVYETNVVEGQQLLGGKVIWDKRNLAGKKVASGVYIAMLSTKDNSETAITKIAIIN